MRFDGAPADPNAVKDSAELVVDAVGTGGGRFVAAGNLNGVSGDDMITGTGPGMIAERAAINAFESYFAGSERRLR